MNRVQDRLIHLLRGLAPGYGRVSACKVPFAAPPANAGDWPFCDVPLRPFAPDQSRALSLRAQGQHLVRQELWEDLGRALRHADRARAVTADGVAVAHLLADGARADVVDPVRRALSDPGLMSAHAPRGGLAALDEILGDYPDDHGVALVVALAHVDVGWAWRGQGWISEVPEAHWSAFHHHFDRAGDILDAFDPVERDSPALADARCALLPGMAAPQRRVIEAYEDLIELDPRNPQSLRALGLHLLPRWFGSHDLLLAEARRCAARLSDIWGAGAYAWTLLDALATDPEVLAHIDTDHFLDAVADILSRRPDPHYANLMAAFTAVTLAQPRGATQGGARTPHRLQAALSEIVLPHLTEVHPLVWGMAPGQGGRRAGLDETAATGRARAHLWLTAQRGRMARRPRALTMPARA